MRVNPGNTNEGQYDNMTPSFSRIFSEIPWIFPEKIDNHSGFNL